MASNKPTATPPADLNAPELPTAKDASPPAAPELPTAVEQPAIDPVTE